jgi:hypothetical protein
MPRKCSKCHREGHYRSTCYKYPPPEPQSITDSDSDVDVDGNDGNDGNEDDDKEIEISLESDKMLNTKTTDEFIEEFFRGYKKTKEQYEYSDPENQIYNEITNKFFQEKFKHNSNGRVFIPDMIDVMTTKYISRLFPGNVEICKDFAAILRKFQAEDRYIKE